MGENARICWCADPKPWLIESKIIAELVLPLNLDQNKHSGFHTAYLLHGGLSGRLH
jgi:hypothetical protein